MERERYVPTVDQVVAALTQTILEVQVESAEDPAQGGVLGAVLRVEGAAAGVECWLLRLLAAGIPLAIGIYLIVAFGNVTLGAIVIAASPVLLLVLVGIERLLARLGRAVTQSSRAHHRRWPWQQPAREGVAGREDAAAHRMCTRSPCASDERPRRRQ